MPLAIWRLLSLLRPTLPPGLRASSRVTPRRDTTPGPGRKYTLIAMCHHGLIGVCHACYDRPSFRRHGHRRHWRWKNKNNTPRVSISGHQLLASLREKSLSCVNNFSLRWILTAPSNTALLPGASWGRGAARLREALRPSSAPISASPRCSRKPGPGEWHYTSPEALSLFQFLQTDTQVGV